MWQKSWVAILPESEFKAVITKNTVHITRANVYCLKCTTWISINIVTSHITLRCGNTKHLRSPTLKTLQQTLADVEIQCIKINSNLFLILIGSTKVHEIPRTPKFPKGIYN